MKPATNSIVRNPGSAKDAAELTRQSNKWRDGYNSMRDLTIARVVFWIEAAQRGDFAELQRTLQKVERRYPVLRALIARHQAAMQKLDWEILIVSKKDKGVTPEMEQAQRRFLRSRYELIGNLTEALGFLQMAMFRGFSFLQKHFFKDGPNKGAVRELHWLPQWNFVRDGMFGDWFWNANASSGVSAEKLGEKNRIGGPNFPASDFLIRQVSTPLYEIALVAFVNWLMARKDWAGFVEIFGLPSAVVIMPPNIPTGQEDDYRDAAARVAESVNGALPHGSDVKFPGEYVRLNFPFKEFCDVMDKDVVLAGTGGLLTMLSMPQGAGNGAAKTHGDAFDSLMEGAASEINEIFNKQFDDVELDAAFPGQPHVAYFRLAPANRENLTAYVENLARLHAAGYRMADKQVEEKTGYPLTRSPLPTPPPAPPALQNRRAPLPLKSPAPELKSNGPELSPEELNQIRNRYFPRRKKK
ncbi:MAG: DUF935 family protein [Verrucomicrobiota bacterium]